MKKLYFILSFTALATSCNKNEGSSQVSQDVISNDRRNERILTGNSQERLNGQYCFEKVLNRDTTRISLNIHNNEIIGEMEWRPFEKDGATGILKGKLNSDHEMDLLYDYMIEGVYQRETKIMKIKNGKLLIKTGELIDPKYNGNLSYKDKTRAQYTDSLNAVACEK